MDRVDPRNSKVYKDFLRSQSPSDDEQDEIERLKREFLEAVEEEKDAASRASLLAEELRDLGVDPDELDSR